MTEFVPLLLAGYVVASFQVACYGSWSTRGLTWIDWNHSQTDWQKFANNHHLIYKCRQTVNTLQSVRENPPHVVVQLLQNNTSTQ